MPRSHHSVEFEALRLKAGLSRAETADLLGVTEFTVIRYENGASRPSPIAIKWLQEHLAILPSPLIPVSVLGSRINGRDHDGAHESGRVVDVARSNATLRTPTMRNVATEKRRAEEPASVMPLSFAKCVPSKSWELTVSSLGLESSLALKSIGELASLFEADASNEIWRSLWEQHCCNYFDLAEADRLLEQCAFSSKRSRLFFLQAYCKMVLAAILERAGFDLAGVSRPGFFDWLTLMSADDVAAIKEEIKSIVALSDIGAGSTAQELSNFLSYMYQEIFPPALRHLTGEYYTPSWLIDHTFSSIDCLSNDLPRIIFDPAAGSGGFLAHYIERTGAQGTLDPIKIIAADINPLAVEFCQANLAIATKRQTIDRAIECSVLLADTIFDPVVDGSGPLFGEAVCFEKVLFERKFIKGQDWSTNILDLCKQFGMTERATVLLARAMTRYLDDSFVVVESVKADLVIGNPPWMTWDALRREYRDKLAVQWAASTLITQKGWRAKVAAGKTDLSTLFVYRAAQRHAAANARMGFVLPLSLFQSRHAGAGFRRFCTAEGRHYGLLSLDDFSDIKVFGDAANRTAVALFEVDKGSCYPTPYLEWSNGSALGTLSAEVKVCQPIDRDDPNSPIVAFSKGDTTSLSGVGKSQYQARGGVNTGGANTILWINILAKNGSLLEVRNVGVTKKARSEIRSGWAEEDAVHPLLVGLDVVRWKAQPSKHLLLFYSPEHPKKAMDESKVKRQFPNAYEFACQFRSELLARKEYHRWGGVGPFYEVYRIGPYTFSQIKVVWQHTGFRGRLRVAVIDDRNRVLTIPDQKVILIPSNDIDEAHYICAFLSSNFVSTTLQKYLGTDASTHILDYIGLDLYSSEKERHRRLAALSQLAHEAALAERPTEGFESEIDAIVDEMRRLN
jgi:transcriptional regulator with XRE-family HTH domain